MDDPIDPPDGPSTRQGDILLVGGGVGGVGGGGGLVIEIDGLSELMDWDGLG